MSEECYLVVLVRRLAKPQACRHRLEWTKRLVNLISAASLQWQRFDFRLRLAQRLKADPESKPLSQLRAAAEPVRTFI